MTRPDTIYHAALVASEMERTPRRRAARQQPLLREMALGGPCSRVDRRSASAARYCE